MRLFKNIELSWQKDRSGPEDWQSGLLALKDALLMERELNRLLLNLRSEAKNRNDYHVSCVHFVFLQSYDRTQLKKFAYNCSSFSQAGATDTLPDFQIRLKPVFKLSVYLKLILSRYFFTVKEK